MMCPRILQCADSSAHSITTTKGDFESLQACNFSAAAHLSVVAARPIKTSMVRQLWKSCPHRGWPVFRERAVLHRAPHGRLCPPSLPRDTGSA